jgi:hypothetical protein
MPMPRVLLSITFALILCLAHGAHACPICGQPTVTLAERYARADTALLVEWVSTKADDEGIPDSTTYEIAQVQRAAEGAFEKGERITVDGYHAGKSGSLVLLLGNKTDKGAIKWDYPPLDVTETSFQYVIQAPSPETPRTRRLEYFVRFLEYPDLTIANDAFAEFVNAPSADIFAVASKLPREKLRRWLLDEKTPLNRQAGYGLMLGLCGKKSDGKKSNGEKSDAALLEGRILDESEDRRAGIEGLIVGYLLLTGEKGLERLEATRIRNSRDEPGEAYPVQQALRYFWTYCHDRISRDRVQQAMRHLLSDPTFTENVVVDLARWKDWEIMADLIRLYSLPEYDDPKIKTAIIGFMIAATKDVPKSTTTEVPKVPKEPLPRHATEAAEYLRILTAKDPKLVRRAEQTFFLK